MRSLLGLTARMVRGVSERQLLSVRQDILGSDGRRDLKILQGAKVGAHAVQGVHRRRIDQVRFLRTGLLRRQRRRKAGREHEQHDCVSNVSFH